MKACPPLGFQPPFQPNIAGRRPAMFGWKAGGGSGVRVFGCLGLQGLGLQGLGLQGLGLQGLGLQGCQSSWPKSKLAQVVQFFLGHQILAQVELTCRPSRHQPCSEERIDVLSNTIERYHSSRNTPSLLYPESCSDRHWRSHFREGLCVTSASSKDFLET